MHGLEHDHIVNSYERRDVALHHGWIGQGKVE
jgi:hypothetical protein